MSTTTEQTRVAAIYNPQTQSKTHLIEGFVVRQNTFKTLFKVIKEAKMEVPEQHYLLLGRRGMGKTTLLLRLAYEVENDPALNPWLIPLVFNEEEYSVRRLFKFWERIMDLLEERHPDFRFEEAERRRLSVQYKDDDSYERALFEWLSGELERTGRKLLLFVDNFGDMARKLTDEEAHRLRKILQTSSDLRIIAASAVVLEAFYRYDHPFYEFFKVVELKGLDAKETRDLLLSLSQHYRKEAVARIVEQHPGRVEALRRITGGVTRTMVLLFEIFADDDDGSAFKDLEVVLDRTTPLYKHRMDDLSDQQQAIVEAIALNWDALSVKEIAERTRLESKIISAQLQYLEKNGIIQKVPTKTKNHLYIVAERFFNIWYLMRNGRRGDEKRVLWLVRFFEDWCDGDMMKARAALHRVALQKGGFDPEAALTYTQALAQTQKLSAAERHELLRDTRSFLLEKSPDLAADLMPSELDAAYAALELWFGGQQDAALAQMEPLCGRLFDQATLERIQQGSQAEGTRSFWEKEMPEAATKIGFNFALLSQPDFDIAEQCWNWAAARGFAWGMFNLGLLFQNEKKNFEKAMDWYEKAAVAGNANAMFNLGWLFENEKKDFDKAFEWYEKAAAAGNADAMNNLGVLCKTEKKDLDKAIYWYEKAAEAGHVSAMNNLGMFFETEKKDLDRAMHWYEKGAKEGDTDAMFSLGLLFHDEKKNFDKAMSWYEKAAAVGNSKAMCNLGWLFQYEKKDINKAIDWYGKAAVAGEVTAMFNLGVFFKTEKKDLDKAIEWYRKATAGGNADAMNSLGQIFQNEKKDIDKAIEWYEKAAEAGNANAMNGLAWLLFEQKTQQEKTLTWARKALQQDEGNAWVQHTAACVLAWNNQMAESKILALKFLQHQELVEKEADAITTYLTLLLAKNEYLWLYEVFTSPEGEAVQLKDRFKPIWYAILKKLDHPDFLRMGEELAQTVDEILAKAERMAMEYA